MRRLVSPIAAVLLALALVVPAQAEKWRWYQIKGGAVAYDEDSRKTDVVAGKVGADTVIFYDAPRKVGDQAYSFVAERLEFECRADRHKWSQSAVLDIDGRVVLARDDGDWTPIGVDKGSTALFARMLCLSQTPPGGKESPDFQTALVDIKRASAAAGTLASLAFAPPPRSEPAGKAPLVAPALPAKAAAPAAVPPPAASATVVKTVPAAPAPPVELAVGTAPPIAALPAAPVATLPRPAGQTPYPQAPRCLAFKEQRNFVHTAFNDCAYRVNYAWCVTGASEPRAECGGPTIARGAGSVAANANAASNYPGGLGRLHVFACRAPGIPAPRETAPGRFEYDCLGPAPATAPPSAKAPAPKAPVAKAPAPKEPELRRLTR